MPKVGLGTPATSPLDDSPLATRREPPTPGSREKAVRSAFDQLWHETDVRCSLTLKRHLVLDRLRGHAERGRGAMEGRRLGELSLEWYCSVLGWNPGEFTEQRQAYANSISAFAERASHTKGLMPLCDEKGQAIMGIGFLRWISADSRELLTGLYLGGMRDAVEVRAKVDQIYGDRLGVNGHHTHSSDDAAIMAAGLMFGFGVACGVWLADALDSLEKGLPGHPDADYLLAQRIAKSGVSLPVTDKDLYSLSFICSVPDRLRGILPDSSLREMLTVDNHTDETSLESYLLAVAGRPGPTIPLPDGEMSSRDLYQWVRDRLDDEKNIS